MERAERLMVTAAEGKGKSTLGRQFGMAPASGIHPFTFQPIDPIRVLLIDLENGDDHVRRELAKVRAIAGDHYQPGHLRVHVAGGMDLTDKDQAEDLLRRVEANKAELLVTGPLYKMADGDPSDEPTAKAVSRALDRVREHFGTAIILEAHTPHATAGNARPKRPYGASLWMRWPEYGIHLGDDGTLTHWRTPREERAWPARLIRGGDDNWPWITGTRGNATTTTADGEFRPTWYMEQASRCLERETAAGQHPTKDALAKDVGKNRAYVLKAVDALIAEGHVDRVDKTHLRSVTPYREADDK